MRMTIKHRLIKFFGGKYYRFKGTEGEEVYWYHGTLKAWFETLIYSYRKNKLLRKSEKLEGKYLRHQTMAKRLKKEHNLLMEEFNNFK